MGDWLKVEKDTPRKPETLAIAQRLDITPEVAFRKLFDVWCWVDDHTTNGRVRGGTYKMVDEIALIPGFAEAMEKEHWLRLKNGVLLFPKIDRHCGTTAKTRSQNAVRANRHRSKQRYESNGEVTPDALPRERTRERERVNGRSRPRAREKFPTERMPEATILYAETMRKIGGTSDRTVWRLACLAALGRIEPEAIESAAEGCRMLSPKKPAAYLTKCVRESCDKAGESMQSLLAGLDAPAPPSLEMPTGYPTMKGISDDD